MLGTQLAVVLRAKGGNFMIQTNGIPGKIVQDASTEALAILGRHAAEGAAGTAHPADASGDAAPNLALGQVSVLQGRWTATYRMVGSILVLVISDPGSNAFTCLRLLDACGKALVAASKGVDVTPERLSKRYAEVHGFLGGLLAGGLASLPPAFVHASATDERLLSARRLRRMGGGTQAKSAFTQEKAAEQSEGAAGAGAEAPQPETPTQRDGAGIFAAEGADPLKGVEFAIPADALPPPPARAAGARRRPPAPPPRPTAAPAAFKGALEEDASPAEVEGFGAFAPVELMEAEKAGEAEVAAEEAEGAAAGEAAAEAEPEPSGPSLTDLRDSLQLVEIYRGEVAGGQLRTARVDGAVRRRLAPFGLEAARFRLVPSSTLVVNACLQTAARNAAHASEPGADYAFTARLTGAPMDCDYVRYALPGVACSPPLQVDLLVAPQSESTGVKRPGAAAGWEALIVLQWAADPGLQGPLLDVVVEVDLPPELAALVRTSPAAQWSPEQCRLRWALGRVAPGAAGLARAVVAAKPGTPHDRAAAALQEATAARVVFTGWPGAVPSGAGLEVAMPGEGEAEFHAGRAVWFGEVTVKP